MTTKVEVPGKRRGSTTIEIDGEALKLFNGATIDDDTADKLTKHEAVSSGRVKLLREVAVAPAQKPEDKKSDPKPGK
jgi:hypothetical protein